MKQKAFTFLKNEIVLVLSFVLAAVSAFFVPLSKQYAAYIDFRTLALLFSLMAVMAGFSQAGVFKWIAKKLLRKAEKTNQLYLVLVLLCFFSAMVITNDVALITFVPFTVITLKMAKQEKLLIFITVAETVAANLGSMLTPIGNPQNLYLFSLFNLSAFDFVKTIFPYSALSLVLLLFGSFFVKKSDIRLESETDETILSKKAILLYSVLFLLALLSVFRVLPYPILLGVVLLALLLFDRRNFINIDYSLLLTFVFLFIFIGNLGNIEIINRFLQKIVVGHEVPVGIIASQVFSNVPACLLLSGFTQDAKGLLIGTNLGGLGTLIASMASLISYKLIQKEKIKSGAYLLVFTGINALFLALNIVLWLVIK
ncbi:MAG TPA: citrate transporter [Ruminococcaceae bacterium]|nr:citrate transporter [Oscillospiraceae bacterium]